MASPVRGGVMWPRAKPWKDGPRPLQFPLPRLEGEGCTQDPRLSPWAKLCRPPRRADLCHERRLHDAGMRATLTDERKTTVILRFPLDYNEVAQDYKPRNLCYGSGMPAVLEKLRNRLGNRPR